MSTLARTGQGERGMPHERSPLRPDHHLTSDDTGPLLGPPTTQNPPPYSLTSNDPSGPHDEANVPLNRPGLSLRIPTGSTSRWFVIGGFSIILIQFITFILTCGLSAYINQFKQTRTQLREQEDATRQAADRLAEERFAYRNESIHLQKERLALDSSTLEMEEEKLALESAIRRSERERLRLEKQEKSLEAERLGFEKQRHLFENERSLWKEQELALREEREKWEKECIALRNETARLEKERLALDSSTREMEEERQALESAIRRSEQERERLGEQKSLLEAERARLAKQEHLLEDERNLWEKQELALREERERWERAREEQKIPQGAFWEVVWPAWDCRAYGKREYWGILRNIPENRNDMDACMNMPVEIRGVAIRRPHRCEYRDGSMHGFWMVDWDQPDCKPWHQNFVVGGCTNWGSGLRRIEAEVVGINDKGGQDWRLLCETTPMVWNHVTYSSPTHCQDRGQKIAAWDVPDDNC